MESQILAIPTDPTTLHLIPFKTLFIKDASVIIITSGGTLPPAIG